MDYKNKYIKYKMKYLSLIGGYKKKLKNKNIEQITKINNYNSIENMETNQIYTEHLSEPWFSLILLGLKTIEGRKNKGRFKDIKIGDIIEWTNNDFLERKFQTKIIRKTVYTTFAEYLETEGINKCLPGMEKFGLKHGLSVYFSYYTKEDEMTFGVVAFEFEII